MKGKNGVRQTGRSGSVSVLKHQNNQGKRHIQIEARNIEDIHSVIKKNNELLRFRIPIDGDKFVPRYAYKAILKIALSLLPVKELCLYRQNLECLQEIDDAPGDYPLRVGFSYASIGNAPPTIGCIILQRKNDSDPIPYIIAMFQAGSVCFQIAPRSEEKDRHISNVDALGIVWTTQLAKPEGGFFPIEYSSPIQFDWSGLKPQLQPFEAFELMFNAHTTQGAYRPLARRSDQ